MINSSTSIRFLTTMSNVESNIQLFTKWTGRNEIITSRDGKILTARDGKSFLPQVMVKDSYPSGRRPRVVRIFYHHTR